MLKPFTDVELLKIDTARFPALPQNRKGILQQAEESEKKLPGEIQLVSNFSSCTTPIVNRNTLTLGNISNPYGISQVSPVLSSGGGSWAERLQTWGNQGRQISEMSTKSLFAQEGEVIHYNAPIAPRFRAGGSLSLSLSLSCCPRRSREQSEKMSER